MTRPNWDQTWMSVAVAMSKRSKCVNRQVGAVIVTKENRPMAVGYNGPPANLGTSDNIMHFGNQQKSANTNNSCDGFCPRGGSNDRGPSYSNCVSVHAEANALLFADRRDYEGGTIYVTQPPCWDCAKLIANSGVVKVLVRANEEDPPFPSDPARDFLRSCGITVGIVRMSN
jgi:dCMP deaminase